MIPIFLKSKIHFNLLIFSLAAMTILFKYEEMKGRGNLLTFLYIFILCVVVPQIFYIWRWSSKPLLIIENGNLFINKIDTFSISEIEHIEVIKVEGAYIFFDDNAIAIKFATQRACDILFKNQNRFSYKQRGGGSMAPFEITNCTLLIYAPLSIPREDIVSFTEKK